MIRIPHEINGGDLLFHNGGEVMVTPNGVGLNYDNPVSKQMIPVGAQYTDAQRHEMEGERGAMAVRRATNKAAKYLAPLVMAPGIYTIAVPTSAVISNPYVQTAFAADAAYRQGFTNKGVRKTARLINEGNYNDAVLSGLGDVMDLIMMSPTLYKGASLLNTRYVKPYKISRAINQGVKENGIITGYNRNSRNLDAGSLWDYQSYLDEVFPNSQINDIQWHGGRPGIEKFKSPQSEGYVGEHSGPFGNSTGQEGIYVSPDRDIAYRLRPRGKSEVYPVLINAENPYVSNQWLSYPFNREGFTASHIRTKDLQGPLKGHDGLTHLGENAVWSPNQTLILGSNEDAIGFSNWIYRNQKPNNLFNRQHLKTTHN